MMVDISTLPVRELSLLERMALIAGAEVALERKGSVKAFLLPREG